MLSNHAQTVLQVATGSEKVGKEIAAAIDASAALSPAGDVAAIATANAATQTSSYVEADVQTIATLANQTKTTVNAILTALKAAGLMS